MENSAQPELCRLHTLRVARIDNKGVWLEINEDLVRLPRREAPEVVYGEQIEVFLYRNLAGELLATSHPALAQAGDFALLTVKSVGPHGAFLDWGLAKDLLVPFTLQPERMQVGRSYLVKVELDPQDRPFGNARIDDCLDRTRPDLHEGDAVALLVWQFTDLGAKVIVNHRFPALIYREELPAGTHPGMQLPGYVKRLRDDGKLDVTLRKVGAEGVADAREAILAALAANGGRLPLSDKSSPTIIQQTLAMSKKTYKKAVGGLYKDGLVTLTIEEVRLTVKGSGANFEK